MTLGVMLNWAVIIIGATFICRAINDNFTGIANVVFIGLVLALAAGMGYWAWRQEHKTEHKTEEKKQ